MNICQSLSSRNELQHSYEAWSGTCPGLVLFSGGIFGCGYSGSTVEKVNRASSSSCKGNFDLIVFEEQGG